MHPANSIPHSRLKGFTRQTGFTLMELMVGMTIGMIATIIIVQVMTVFEAQKRATTGSADAQTNGGIALYTIARELQMAGYPLFPGTDTALSCTTTTSTVAGVTQITPVTITEVAAVAGVSPASDSITIRYGSTTTTATLPGTAPGVTPGVQTQITAVNTNDMTVGSNLGCQASVGPPVYNDIVMLTSGTTCNIAKATAVSAAGAVPITVTLSNPAGASIGVNLSCLGTWNEITYAVNAATGNLQRTVTVNGVSDGSTVNGVVTGTTPIVVGVVNIQAQYGVSATAASNQITSWVNASGGTWAAPTVADRNRIKAIRIAVVARNSKVEPAAVTTACSSTTAANPTGLCAWDGSTFAAPAIDLSPGNTNWGRYRYRVFETVVPLRNVIWSKDTL